MRSLRGHFLISNSTLQDPNFVHTVVFLIEHGKEGAFGLIINRKITSEENPIHLRDILPDLPPSAESIPLYEGGPVSRETLFILFQKEEGIYIPEEGEEVIPEVYIGGSKKLVETLLDYEIPFHAYLGYSGWAPGQLEEEIAQNAWVILKARKELIFHPHPEKVWREALIHKGGLFSYFAKTVNDPFLN